MQDQWSDHIWQGTVPFSYEGSVIHTLSIEINVYYTRSSIWNPDFFTVGKSTSSKVSDHNLAQVRTWFQVHSCTQRPSLDHWFGSCWNEWYTPLRSTFSNHSKQARHDDFSLSSAFLRETKNVTFQAEILKLHDFTAHSGLDFSSKRLPDLDE